MCSQSKRNYWSSSEVILKLTAPSRPRQAKKFFEHEQKQTISGRVCNTHKCHVHRQSSVFKPESETADNNFVISTCSYGFLWIRFQWAFANNEASNHFIQIMILEILSWRAGKEITGLMFGCSVCSLVYYYVEMLFCPIPIKIVSLMHALCFGMINEYLCMDNNKKELKIFWDYYFIM